MLLVEREEEMLQVISVESTLESHKLWAITRFFSYNGKDYINHPDTVNDHYRTSLGNIDNKVLAVGGHSVNNNKVEMFDINSNTWTSKTAFLYCSS